MSPRTFVFVYFQVCKGHKSHFAFRRRQTWCNQFFTLSMLVQPIGTADMLVYLMVRQWLSPQLFELLPDHLLQFFQILSRLMWSSVDKNTNFSLSSSFTPRKLQARWQWGADVASSTSSELQFTLWVPVHPASPLSIHLSFPAASPAEVRTSHRHKSNFLTWTLWPVLRVLWGEMLITNTLVYIRKSESDFLWNQKWYIIPI